MLIEAIAALLVCLGVSLGVRVYLRWFHADAAPNAEFERWCAERPIVLAVRCRPGSARDVLDELRHLVGSGEPFANRAGGYPWQHYLVEVEQRPLAEDVAGLVITGCELQRGVGTRPDVSRLVAGLGAVAAHCEELWLHGQLHSVGRHLRFDRHRAGWIGTISADGTTAVEPLIGRPTWLDRDERRAAGSG